MPTRTDMNWPQSDIMCELPATYSLPFSSYVNAAAAQEKGP